MLSIGMYFLLKRPQNKKPTTTIPYCIDTQSCYDASICKCSTGTKCNGNEPTSTCAPDIPIPYCTDTQSCYDASICKCSTGTKCNGNEPTSTCAPDIPIQPVDCELTQDCTDTRFCTCPFISTCDPQGKVCKIPNIGPTGGTCLYRQDCSNTSVCNCDNDSICDPTMKICIPIVNPGDCRLAQPCKDRSCNCPIGFTCDEIDDGCMPTSPKRVIPCTLTAPCYDASICTCPAGTKCSGTDSTSTCVEN